MNTGQGFFTAPRGVGAGFVPNRLNRMGGVPHANLSTEMAKRVRNGIVDPSLNIAAGPANVDFETILNSGPAINNIVSVSIDSEDVMVNSPLSSVVDLSYSVYSYDQLLNLFTARINHPAEELSDNITPNNSSMVMMEREYNKKTRATTFTIPSNATNAIVQAAKQIQTIVPGDIDPGSVLDPVMDAARKREAKKIIALIKQAITGEVTSAQHSLIMSLVTEARTRLRSMSIPLSLCMSSDLFKTSQSDLGVSNNDLRPWLRNKTVARSVYQLFNKLSVDQTFGLGKNPKFLANMIASADNSLGNLMTNKPFAKGIVIVPDNGGRALGMTGYLAVSKTAVDNVLAPLLQTGRRQGKLKIDLHNESAYRRTDNIGRAYIDLNGDNEDPEDIMGDDPTDVLRMIDGTRGERENAIQKMSDIGRKIFGFGRAGDDIDMTKPKQWLYDLDVDHKCHYFVHNGGAVVVDIVDDKYPRKHDNPNLTPSMVNLRRELMHVSVGDYDHKDPMIYSWASSQTCGAPKIEVQSAKKTFGILPVTSYTPDVNTSKHVFGVNELKRVYMDPALYNPHEILTNLNNQLEMMGKINKSDSQNAPIYSIGFNSLSAASNKENLFKRLVNTRDAGARNDLRRCEFHPFFDFMGVKQQEKMVYSATPRRTFSELPQTVVDIEQHFIRGALIMASISGGAVSMLNDLIVFCYSATSAAVGDEGGKTEDVKKMELLYAEISQLIGAVYPNTTSKDTFEIDQDEIMQNIMYPLLTKGNMTVVGGGDGADAIANNTVAGAADNAGLRRKIQLVGGGWDKIYEKSAKGTPFSRLVRGANVMAVVTQTSASPVHKLCTLVGMSQLINPISISACIETGMPTGFAVDFFKKESIQSSDIIYTTPHAIDMIVTPNPIVVKDMAGGAQKCTLSADLSTVNNMYGAAAVCATASYPNPIAANMADGSSNRTPRVAVDYISRSVHGSLEAIITNYTAKGEHTISKEHAKHISEELSAAESERSRGDAYGKNDHAYVGVLRPVVCPTTEAKPYMGIPRFEAVPVRKGVQPFAEFYSSDYETENPYMSVLGAFYNQRFTRSGTIVGNARTVSMLLNTINCNNSARVCDTTALLEEAFDLNTADLSSLDENASAALSNMLRATAGSGDLTLTHVSGARAMHDSELGRMHDSARMGYSVPYSTYTCETAAKFVAREGLDQKTHDGLAKYARASPYRIKNRAPNMAPLASYAV